MTIFKITPKNNERLALLYGEGHKNLQKIEARYQTTIQSRGNHFEISGKKSAVEKSKMVIQKLYEATKQGKLNSNQLNLLLYECDMNHNDTNHFSKIHLSKRQLKARNKHQSSYIKAIQSHTINFGIGPSGTGKTYLAVACAVEAFEKEEVNRILLVRPAVEAGERLGFLPGNLSEKVDPYLRPLYEALYDMLGTAKVHRYLEEGVIEIAPLAYMRGRTLNNAFILLDESQNTTSSQMKMFLTRLGFGSKMAITGDMTQVDLPSHANSGLKQATIILQSIQDIHFTFFNISDVIRHPVVQSVVEAYEAKEF